MALGRDTAITWLGHATFLIESPGGKRILVDPWLEGNPACPDDRKKVDAVDLVLVTHAHNDHTGDLIAVARQHRPTIVAMIELCDWLEMQGIENTVGMNKGGSTTVGDIRLTMVHATHSSSFNDGEKSIYLGDPAGFVMTLENGFRIYIAGDTAVNMDMRIIGELYAPELAILPIGDFFTMSPKEAAYALRLLNCNQVVPCHYGTFPALVGTPEELRREASGIEGLQVHELRPGETLR